MQVWYTNSGWFQVFRYEARGQHFVNVKDNRVLDVANARDQENRNVVVWKKHGGLNQRWKVAYVDETPKEPTTGLNKAYGLEYNRAFYIVSRMPMRRVLEIVGGRNVVIATRSNKNTQKFFFDGKTKTIKSVAFNDRSLDIANSGRASNLQVWKTNAKWF